MKFSAGQADDGPETAQRKRNDRVTQPAKAVNQHAHGELAEDHRDRGNGGTDALYRQYHYHNVGHAEQGTEQLPFGHVHQGNGLFGFKEEDQQGGDQRHQRKTSETRF